MDEICAHLWKFTELNTVDAEGKTQEGLALQGVSVKDPGQADGWAGSGFLPSGSADDKRRDRTVAGRRLDF